MKAPGLRRRNKIAGQFSARTIEMMESPAFRVLSLSARRVLDRIEIEHAHHGGNDNGRLPVTFSDFVRYGIHRHAVAPALREAEALAFVRLERGRAGNAEFRIATKFRLTYRHSVDGPPTNDWKKIQTLEQAKAIADLARTPIKRPRKRRLKKTESQCRKTHQVGAENAPNRPNIGAETVTTVEVRKPSLLSISRVGGTASTPSTSTDSDLKSAGEIFARKRKPMEA